MTGAQEAFLAKLPKGTLLPLEVKLRSSLLRTAYLAAELLPPNGVVSLQDWVDYRMSDEIVLKVNAWGRVVLVSLVAYDDAEADTDSKGPQPKTGFFSSGRREESNVVPGRLPSAHPLGTTSPRTNVIKPPSPQFAASSNRKSKRVRTSTTPQEFLDSLPADSFVDEEVRLREAVLGFLCSGAAVQHHAISEHKPKTLASCSEDRVVRQAQAAFLPTECPLLDWLQNRIGDEVLIEEGTIGQILLRPTIAGLDAYKESLQEAFFASLPSDHLTEKEEKLQVAIDSFLQNWSSASPPTLSDIGVDPRCRDARNELFPPARNRESLFGYQAPGRISIKSWLDRRLGDVFETMVLDRIVVIGFKGAIDEEAAFRLSDQKKTRRESGTNSTATGSWRKDSRNIDSWKGSSKSSVKWPMR